MALMNFIKNELQGWGKIERIIFPLEILLIVVISLYMGDNKIALISAVCGISYTILAGKGKISCYIFGLTGTMCYAYIAFLNTLYGNLFLYALYYFPMQVLGIFKWRQNLNSKTREIVKTTLTMNERIIYFICAIIGSILLAMILELSGDKTPYIDGITTIFSVIGLLLTVKRCIEQWYIWIVVNGLSMIMWIEAYKNGSNCFATILMWATYLVLAFYFLHTWKKEIEAGK